MAEGKVYAHVTIREKTHMDNVDGRFVLVLDMDPATRRGFHTYEAALFKAIQVLAGYAQ